MSIALIKPGDRIIITEHPALRAGDIVAVTEGLNADGFYYAAKYFIKPSQCLRILAPCDVIPKGAVTRVVRCNGDLSAPATHWGEWVKQDDYETRALVSLPDPEPEPEPSLLTELERLQERHAAEIAELRKRIEEAS